METLIDTSRKAGEFYRDYKLARQMASLAIVNASINNKRTEIERVYLTRNHLDEIETPNSPFRSKTTAERSAEKFKIDAEVQQLKAEDYATQANNIVDLATVHYLENVESYQELAIFENQARVNQRKTKQW